MVWGIAVTNNVIEYIIKVIKFLEHTGILLKRTTEKIIPKKENSLVVFLVCYL